MSLFKNHKSSIKNRASRPFLIGSLIFILILLPTIYIVLREPKDAKAWFNDSFGYRSPISFTHNADISTARRVQITVNTATLISNNKMQSDCDDTRFTDGNGRELRFQLTGTCNNASTTYDVVFNSIKNDTNSGYIYYGNPAASSKSQDVSSYTSLTPSGSPSFGSEEIQAFPVLGWSFDEGYGSTANDSTGRGVTGSISGAVYKTDDLCLKDKCLYFDGSNDVVTGGSTVYAVKSISFWARVMSTSTTEQLVDLNGSAYITSVSGTITQTGFTGSTIYVDGKVASTITANTWHHITVTASTAVTASSIKLAQISTNYGNLFMDEFQLYTSELSANQVKSVYNSRGGSVVSIQFGDSNQRTLSDGLVGYWNEDEASNGATAIDNSGNATTLTDAATVVRTTGIYGNSGDFESASSQYQYAADNAALSITGSLTMSAWIKPESVSAGTWNIAGKWDGSNESYRLYQSTNQIVLEVESGNTATSTTTLTAGTWYHVVGTYDSSSQKIRLYINGIEEATTIGGTIPSSIGDDAGAFQIGAEDRNNTPKNFYDGLIDEVHVYNRALSSQEISQLYNWAPSPIAHWKLDENTGSSAYDTGSNGFVGTLTNSPQRTPGKFGGSVLGDGTEKYISVSHNSTLNLSGNFTIEGWVKPQTNTYLTNPGNYTASIIQKANGTDGYELGITNDLVPYTSLSNSSKTWTRYDNTGVAACSQTEGNDDGCVLDKGASGSWNQTYNYGVHVLKDGSTYKMWHSGYSGSVIRIGYATSTDGISWTPYDDVGSAACGQSEANDNGCIFGLASGGAWDDAHVSMPTVIKDGNTYKMWYEGYDGTSAAGRIGYATSTDGITWTRYAGNNCAGTSGDGCVFVPGSSGQWDELTFGEPYVIKDGSTYKMWYIGNTTSRIGYATSSDGITWTRYDDTGSAACGQTEANDNGCVFNIASDTYWDDSSVHNPSVVKDGSTYHLFYSGFSGSNYKIGYATSSDGISWTRYDNTSSVACSMTEGTDDGCIFGTNGSGWDSVHTSYHMVIKEGSTFKVWYSGYNGTNYRIGYFTYTPGVSDTAALTSNTFSHITAVKNNTTLSLYVNGILKASTSTSVTTLSNSSNLILGNYLNGAFDDVKIYNYARTPSQIIQDMNGGHPLVGTPIAGAVAHWSFDEGYSTNANDQTPNNNDLTLSTASWTNDGKYGKAWDGTGGLWLSRADDPDFDFTASEDFSITGWFRHDTASAVEVILNKEESTGADGGYRIQMETDGDITFGIDDDNSSFPEDFVTSTAANYDDNNWHHLAAIKTGTTSMRLYIDGKEVGTADTSILSTGTLVNDDTLYIGDSDGANGTDEFNGELDELKIYRAALTQAEILADMNQGKSLVLGSASTASNGITPDNSGAREYCVPGDTTTCGAPVGEWKLDENTSTSAYDTSTNNNTGSLVNTPTWARGKMGSSIILSGASSQYITVADHSSLDIASSFSLSVWVYPTNLATAAMVLSKGTGSNYEMLIDTDGSVVVLKGSGCSSLPGAVTTNTWAHIASTYNTSNDTNYIYINGVLNNYCTGDATEPTPNNDPLTIGAYYNSGTPDTFYTGRVDQLRVYNYPRSAAQVAWDYSKGKPVAHWQFDECSGSTINDNSGNSNSGTIYFSSQSAYTSAGFCNSGTASHMWNAGTTGKFNSAFATDDSGFAEQTHIKLTNNAFDSLTEGSIAFWFKSTDTGDQYHGIFSACEQDSDAFSDCYEIFFDTTNNRVGLWVNNDGGAAELDAYTESITNTTSWHHVALTVTSSGHTLYIDGVPKTLTYSLGSSSTNLFFDDVSDNTTNYSIGCYDADNTAGSCYEPEKFRGLIDDFRIYNYPLTRVLVQQTINDGSAIKFN